MRVIVERLKIMYGNGTIDEAKLLIAITKYKLTDEEILFVKGE